MSPAHVGIVILLVLGTGAALGVSARVWRWLWRGRRGI